MVSGMPPGLDGGTEPESLSPYEQQLMHLERQLDIESKVNTTAILEKRIDCFRLNTAYPIFGSIYHCIAGLEL